MAENTVPFIQRTIDNISSLFGTGTPAYNALLDAAKRSPSSMPGKAWIARGLPLRGALSTLGRMANRAIWRQALILALAGLALVSGGCALGQNSQDAAQPAPCKEITMAQADESAARAQQDMYSQIRQPKYPMEVLNNLKYVLDHDLLLRKDFYTVENLQKFFGAIDIDILPRPDGGVHVIAYHRGYLDHIVPPYQFEEKSYDLSNTQLGGGIYLNKQGKLAGTINLIFIRRLGPNSDDVEKVFSKAWELVRGLPRVPPPEPRVIGTLGNEIIRYHFDDACVTRTIAASFNADVSLQSIRLSAEVR